MQICEFYQFLNANYEEDDIMKFRFDYIPGQFAFSELFQLFVLILLIDYIKSHFLGL